MSSSFLPVWLPRLLVLSVLFGGVSCAAPRPPSIPEESVMVPTSTEATATAQGPYLADEEMYVIPYREISIALPTKLIREKKKLTLPVYNVVLTATLEGEDIVVRLNTDRIPGTLSTWQSWFSVHESNGVIWDK